MSSTPWAGRRLHFIGVGGAGMSGLALVAQRARRRGDRARTGPSRATSSACARRASSPRSATTPRTCPDGAEVVVSTAIPDDNPELAAARERGRGRAPPRRPARRGRRACGARSPWPARTGRRRRPAWPRTCWSRRAATRLPDRRRGPLDRDERGVGRGGVARRRGGRVRPLVPQAVRRGRGRDERRARPSRDVRDARRARGGLRALHRGRAGGDRRPRGAGDRAAAAGLALHGARRGVRALGARAPQRAERLGRRARLPRGGRRAGGVGAGAALVRRRRPPLRVARDGSRGQPGLRRLRPPPDRGAGDARGRANARSRSASWPASSRTSTRARSHLARDFGKALALADVAVVLDVYPRASAPTTSRASAAGSSRRRPRTPPAGGRSTGRRARRTPSACCGRSCGRATRS